MSSGIHESSGAYALHALHGAELAEYEAHLATCRTCPAEVDTFHETAAELSLLVEATPPAGMRERILDSVLRLPQAPQVPQVPQVPVFDDDTVLRPLPPIDGYTGPRRAQPGSEVVDEPEPPPVDELAVRRSRRRARVLSGLVAAMLALAVGLGGVVYSLVQERQTQVASQRLEDELLRAPDAEIFVKPLADGGRVTFIVSKELNRAQFIGTDLPDPGENRFQLWTGVGGLENPDHAVVRDVQISDRGGNVEVFYSGDIRQSDFLAVNLEPAGSTPEKPTNAPFAGSDI